MQRVGLIGCGVIGSALIEAIIDGQLPDARLVAILSTSISPAASRARRVLDTHLVDSIEALIAYKPNLVFEAAEHQAVRSYARTVLAAGIDLLLMSIGALADPDLRRDLTDLADQQGAAILIPSGAIGGLDVLRACQCQGELDQVVLTSTKHPRALAGQPYILDRAVGLDNLDAPLTVFDGSAAEACLAFPKSTNIAAAVSLAGLGFDRTRVCVVADPDAERTVHSLEARGGFGELELTLHNYPHPENPRTSYLACLGAVAAVKNLQGSLRFI